jgi:hypothetical protein
MIFAICGLTVAGTGTDRAGTSNIAELAVWACPAGNPRVPIAAHQKSAGAINFCINWEVTKIRIPSAGVLIAFPYSFF